MHSSHTKYRLKHDKIEKKKKQHKIAMHIIDDKIGVKNIPHKARPNIDCR